MLDASHVVVFCAKTAMDDAWLKLVVDQKMPMAALPRRKRKPRTIKVASSSPICTVKICMMMRSGWQNRFISTSVTSCSAWRRWVWTRYSIEGFDAAILDAEFGLKEKGYTSLVVVPVGHHSVEDFNATLPKSRLPQNITLTEV